MADILIGTPGASRKHGPFRPTLDQSGHGVVSPRVWPGRNVRRSRPWSSKPRARGARSKLRSSRCRSTACTVAVHGCPGRRTSSPTLDQHRCVQVRSGPPRHKIRGATQPRNDNVAQRCGADRLATRSSRDPGGRSVMPRPSDWSDRQTVALGVAMERARSPEEPGKGSAASAKTQKNCRAQRAPGSAGTGARRVVVGPVPRISCCSSSMRWSRRIASCAAAVSSSCSRAGMSSSYL
jgi:hypothetical protein